MTSCPRSSLGALFNDFTLDRPSCVGAPHEQAKPKATRMRERIAMDSRTARSARQGFDRPMARERRSPHWCAPRACPYASARIGSRGDPDRARTDTVLSVPCEVSSKGLNLVASFTETLQGRAPLRQQAFLSRRRSASTSTPHPRSVSSTTPSARLLTGSVFPTRRRVLFTGGSRRSCASAK